MLHRCVQHVPFSPYTSQVHNLTTTFLVVRKTFSLILCHTRCYTLIDGTTFAVSLLCVCVAFWRHSSLDHVTWQVSGEHELVHRAIFTCRAMFQMLVTLLYLNVRVCSFLLQLLRPVLIIYTTDWPRYIRLKTNPYIIFINNQLVGCNVVNWTHYFYSPESWTSPRLFECNAERFQATETQWFSALHNLQ